MTGCGRGCCGLTGSLRRRQHHPSPVRNAYNQAVVYPSNRQFLRWALRLGSIPLVISIAVSCAAWAQTPADGESEHGRILLVLPLDNKSGQPSLEWIREAAPEILSSRFGSAGFAPLSR